MRKVKIDTRPLSQRQQFENYIRICGGLGTEGIKEKVAEILGWKIEDVRQCWPTELPPNATPEETEWFNRVQKWQAVRDREIELYGDVQHKEEGEPELPFIDAWLREQGMLD